MSHFQFNASGAKKKPRKKDPKPALTHELAREDNPNWEILARANDVKRQANEVAKQKAKQKDHTQIHVYLCIVFQSREQKREFLEKIPEVHCVDEVFIDGETFSQAINLPVTPNEIPVIKTPVSKRLSEMVRKSENS